MRNPVVMLCRLPCLSYFLVCLAAAGIAAASAQERQQLIILTSFPDSVYEPFKRAFEKINPDIVLFILNRKTSSAISYIQDGAGHQVDLFWASAPDAFEILKQSGKLQNLQMAGRGQHANILGFPINDPDGFYVGFAISGYGIMWNSSYLTARKLPEPASWSDLRRAIYANHIGISAPSRSGTTHLIVEIILQSEGWRKGWQTLLEIGGNLATVTARSYGVPSGVEQGHFGVGLVIDFFGLRSRARGHRVRFRYPNETMMLPANIAMIEGAKNPAAARRFIQFLLSDEGQRILFDPAISRLPVMPQIYRDAPQGFPNPFRIKARPGARLFDITTSRKRYHLVNALFDQLITFRLRELKDAWSLVHQAEELLRRRDAPKLRRELARARALLQTIPVSRSLAGDGRFSSLFTRHKPGYAVSARQTALERAWRQDASHRYDAAAQIAERTVEQLRQRITSRPPQ